MNFTDKAEHNLNELIEIARDGAEFYHEAAEKVEAPALRALFRRIEDNKNKIVTVLSSQLHAIGAEPASGGTVRGTFQKLYGKVRATFGDTDYGYVAELEESEDRLLAAFRDVLQNNELSADIRHKVQELLPDVQETHNIMRDHKHSMKK